MINIHARMEVRELPSHNCWAIMHSSNSAIICDNNYAWKTKEEAQFALDQWLTLPFESEVYRIDLIKARKHITDLQVKLSVRNTQIADLKHRLEKARGNNDWIKGAGE